MATMYNYKGMTCFPFGPFAEGKKNMHCFCMTLYTKTSAPVLKMHVLNCQWKLWIQYSVKRKKIYTVFCREFLH